MTPDQVCAALAKALRGLPERPEQATNESLRAYEVELDESLRVLRDLALEVVPKELLE